MTDFIHIVLNAIEAFSFPFFIANYFNFENKKQFIFTISIIQFIILNIFHFYFTSSINLTTTIIFSMLLSIYIFNHRLTFNNIFITVLYNCLICLVALSVLLINNFLSFIFHFWFSLSIDFFLLSCLISRILLLIITIVLLRKKLNLSVSFDFRYWGYTIVLEFLLLCSIGLITYSLTCNEINNTVLITILIFLIIIAVLFILNLFHFDELNKSKIETEKLKQLKKYGKQQINAIKNVKHEINSLNHRMLYIYYRLEFLLQNERYEEAQQLLLSNRRRATKYDMIINTKNIVFDCLMSLKINDLTENGMNINLCIFISVSEFYNNLVFINSIISLLDCLNNQSKLTININEISNYTIIKIFCIKDIASNINKIVSIINTMSKNYKLSYKINNTIKNSIKISIKRNEYYNET